ncbi:pyruvate dehydrogenase [Corynebacterium glucuronolyticum]|uniref:Pyruvate dehydrogenase n=2 Tax=Corynebacterium glucuronolyticum TaxID=39791 RepID=A0AAX1L875_9CORY|nr:pyruvate dehydrogenase [Corynebacterium glucuronolyticum]EEI64248.1 thiamine pyrophosphate enzyme, N-terminal TPP binding domain protein [Corynebacterium glucuronolyticum ATCC 51866]QRP70212.1 pyruvate dehydrogenase [Corynebacterium glucuronolyticum]
MADTLADIIIKKLEETGVTRIFGLVGDSLNPIVDAVRRSKQIEWIHVRNEEAAAFAAGSYSLATGELGVCAASCGPGNTHLIQGLYDSHRNGAKVLALASHIPSRQIGSHYFQETHPEQIFAECSGYCEMANSAEQGAVILHHALQSTLGGHGVSVLVVPGDVTMEKTSYDGIIASEIATSAPTVVPPADQVKDLADAINKADTIALFCGRGVMNAREEVLELAGKVKSPVGHALGGKMFIQHDNPYDVGMSGLLGYGSCHEACTTADLLIMLGTDFPYSDFLPDKNVAQVDINAAAIGRRTRVTHPVVGDVGATIRAVLPLIEEKTNRNFLDKMLKKHAQLLEKIVEAYTDGVEEHTPIHPEYAADILDDLAADDAIFTVDTGMNNVWAARYVTNQSGKRSLLGSFRHGTMANALPHAIGAAYSGRQTIAICGDGGLGMLLGELLTVKLHNIPVKIVVFNNSSLGMVKLEMLVAGLQEFQTDHNKVDFAAIGNAMGIPSVRITDPRCVRDKLAHALSAPGPQLVDIVTDPNALSIPPDITMSMLYGFGRAAAATVLDGGVGKMLDIAKSNLRNIPASLTELT